MAEIDSLFEKLIEAGGSDLHLRVNRAPLIRKDGEIVKLDGLEPLTHEQISALVDEIIPERNRRELKETKDTDFGYEIPDLIRLRCNTCFDRHGASAVFRIIPFDVISADQLNLPKGVRDFCDLSKGLVVVTGPTGCGKSTTLAAMIDLINATRSAHIITIEDPIEFVHRDKCCLISQREVHSHTTSFAAALRAALRQDPDIILVGEMRDLETIEIALETAETGHLVFGTLHTNTAASTVDRIIDSFPEGRQNQIRAMLANSLKGAVSQVLCKRNGGGRVAAMEIMVVDRGIAALIRDGKIHQIGSAMQVGGSKGMVLMNDALGSLVADGQVEPAEAYAKAIEKSEFLDKLRKMGLPPALMPVAPSSVPQSA